MPDPTNRFPLDARLTQAQQAVDLYPLFARRLAEEPLSWVPAAHRDSSFFPDPDRFDILRPNVDKHLGFAYGPHFCFGTPLARLEGQIGLSMLFDRFPRLKSPPDHPAAPYGHEFRSTPNLYVTW